MSNIAYEFKRIGVIGAGNMGSMMAHAFAELELDVYVWDVKSENIDSLMEDIKQTQGLKGKVEGYYDISKFNDSISRPGERKLFIFSISHGQPADSVLEKIKPVLNKGDIILDGGNEHYRNTERRQKECDTIGVHWIGMGVSGGYQAARHGPSLSPGGEKTIVDSVMPLLESYSSKDEKSKRPCVANIGPRGAGHYVKMVHNGIEVGMLSAICEAWAFLSSGLGLSIEEIGKIFEQWNTEGELRNTYLLELSVDICRTKKSDNSGYVLDDVLDKVVQDDDDSEGTPSWSIMESASRHVSCPTLAAGLYLRTASGDRSERLKAAKNLEVPEPKPFINIQKQFHMIKNLKQALYCSILASYCQGLELIGRASKSEGWAINLAECVRIWRAGCIIKSECIADLLEPVLRENTELSNMMLNSQIAKELQKQYTPLKDTVLEGVKFDHYLPAISATLEYIKYCGGKTLPTKYMEAQMDYFGAHSYDKPGVRGEDPGTVRKGKHHYEWKPA